MDEVLDFIKPTTPDEFTREYRPAAEKAGMALGVSPDILLAQWGHETGWGKSVIPGTNNLGNIKDFSGKGVKATDNMTGSRDAYRTYESPEAFAADYADLIKRKYAGAVGSGDNVNKYAAALKAGGYAEDPNYVRKISAAHRTVLPTANPDDVLFFIGDSKTPPPRAQSVVTGANKGIAGILGLPVDTANNIINLGKAAFGTAATALGRPDLAPDVNTAPVGGSAWMADRMRQAGVLGAEATDPTGRVIESAASQIVPALAMRAGGPRVPGQAPVPPQSVPSAVGAGLTSGAAAGVAQEAFPNSPEAGIIGGMLPQAGRFYGAAGLRGLARGSDPSTMQRNIGLFDQADTTPTVGQATENGRMRGIESVLGKVPGGAGPMRAFAEDQAATLSRGVDEIAGKLSPKVGAEDAGRVIEKGVGNFVDRFQAKQSELYNRVDALIPPATPVQSMNTRAMLKTLSDPLTQSPALSEELANSKIGALLKAYSKDTTAAPLPYESLAAIRREVGQRLSGNELIAEAPKAQLKRLYGAVSDDMEIAAKNAGPEALKAWDRANAYTKAGHERIDGILQKVAGQNLPEQVFQAATAGTREGGTTIRTVMKSLRPDERDIITATTVKRLGSAPPGQQNAPGDQFSTETFLTNWNRMSPEAKSALFVQPDVRNALESLAKVAENRRQGSKVLANPSGTATTGTMIGTAAGLGTSLATGNLGATGTILGGILGANVTARMMINPDFVKWLAQTTRVPENKIPAQMARLAVIANQAPGIRSDIRDYVASLK